MKDTTLVGADALTPLWLNLPPDGIFPKPPARTRAQSLPYHDLSWENFERLICRLVRREKDNLECWVYGIPGQEQYGLDVLAKSHDSDDKFSCYQCKRVSDYTASKIEEAVDTFIKGKWFDRTNIFILCTTATLSKTQQIEAISNQQDRLKKFGKSFETWDGADAGKLNEKLKLHSDIVDDFFGREWVIHFNGKEVANALEDRLDGKDNTTLRTELRNVYATLFQRSDPGIRFGTKQTIPLFKRYVTPSIIETREVSKSEKNSEFQKQQTDNFDFTREPEKHVRIAATHQEMRSPIWDWLARHPRSVLLGEPGYGKSTLLRIITLQLLYGLDSPFVLPWDEHLPVWISYGGYCSALLNNNELSIEDYFDQWLHKHCVDSVRPLFKRAMNHKKILLLVDGLDEGHNPLIANQAMGRFSTFLANRSIPAVFTSRPKGYTLVNPNSDWPTSNLASLDNSQIEKFARIWIGHFESEGKNESEDHLTEPITYQRTEDFLKAVRANPQVLDLARTPLFCRMLIDIYRFTHQLPEQRKKVYDKVIELLLSDHPTARAQAAELSSAPNVPRVNDIYEMLMRLALHIQKTGNSGTLSTKECETVFNEYLVDDTNGPGYTSYEAKNQSKSLIEYAQAGLGIIVERAPNELGFFHLTVQEYPAAQAIIRKDGHEQLEWLSDKWNKPDWHEVIINWFSIISSEQGNNKTQKAIDHLKASKLDSLSELHLLRLRSELASSEYLSPKEARQTLQEAAREITTSPFRELKKELAKHLALGLRFPSITKQCAEIISHLTPSHSDWNRSALLRVLGNWTASDDLFASMRGALHDESIRCRIAAAESLAKAFSNDDTVKEYLESVSVFWPDTGVRFAAIYSLSLGWPDHEKLDELANHAIRSSDMSLVLIGIKIRVTKNTHTDNDGLVLWEILTKGLVDYELRKTLGETLVAGWKDSVIIKELAISALDNKPHRGGRLYEEEIVSFLVKCWPGDVAVAKRIGHLLAENESAFHLHDDEIWMALSSGFGKNRNITDPLRKNLDIRKTKYQTIFWGPETMSTCFVLRDEDLKIGAIADYKSVKNIRSASWIINTLLKVWPNDPDVLNLIEQEFKKPPSEVPYLTSIVDSYIKDPDKKKEWLLSALDQKGSLEIYSPAHKLLSEFTGQDSLNVCLKLFEGEIWHYEKISLQNKIIETMPKCSQARTWADLAFEESDSISLASVATSYENDPVLRDKLLNAACPATANVRLEIFRVLQEYSIPRNISLSLTQNIWIEDNSEVHTSGVVALCMSIAHDMPKRKAIVEKLKLELHAVGMRYEIRRRAAFTGLLQLLEYDACVDYIASETTPTLHWLIEHHDSDSSATRILFEHLDVLRKIAAAKSVSIDFSWDALIYNGLAREAFSHRELRSQLTEHLKERIRTGRIPQYGLSLLEELLPNSEDLRSILLDYITSSRHENDYCLEAQRIYAKQFRDNELALNDLEQAHNKLKTNNELPYLYAIALGWPNSKLIGSYIADGNIPRELPIVTALAISGIIGHKKCAIACIDRVIELTRDEGRYLSGLYPACLRDWARNPSSEPILRELLVDKDPSRQISAIRLLESSGKLTESDRVSLKAKLNEIQHSSNIYCEDGIDVLSSKAATVSQILYSLLS